MKHYIIYLIAVGLLWSCSNTATEPKTVTKPTIETSPTNTVILSKDIIWEKLNPARGNQSPQAGTVWGDRHGTVATGFLAKFVDGFSSPPHIHNVTYRAVVIKGLIHNDDEVATSMWMTPGSFWTQPEGESHITAAKGKENIAYVEIDHGPYLVKPPTEAFDNGERPINIDASNVVWLNHTKTNWINTGSNAEISFLWDSKTQKNLKGLFVKLPENYKGIIESDGDILHAILIKGILDYNIPQTNTIKSLDAGSYFGATSKAIHEITNTSNDDIILYIRTNGSLGVN